MTITLTLPTGIGQRMKPAQAKLHLAIGAFAGEELTLGQAAEIAGISQTQLMGELSRRRIPLHYDLAEFAEDLQSLASLNARSGHAGHP